MALIFVIFLLKPNNFSLIMRKTSEKFQVMSILQDILPVLREWVKVNTSKKIWKTVTTKRSWKSQHN